MGGEKKKRTKGEREWGGERENPRLPEPDQWQKCAHLFQGILSRDGALTEQAWTCQDEGRGEIGDPTPDISKPSLRHTVHKIQYEMCLAQGPVSSSATLENQTETIVFACSFFLLLSLQSHSIGLCSRNVF